MPEPTRQTQKTPGPVVRLSPQDPEFPARLLTVPRIVGGDRDGALWVLGDPGVLARRPVLTVVGARAASPAAEARAQELGQAVAAHGGLVVSGGALGVDAAAHRGALRAGGPTAAVLGTGVNVAYPRRHTDLFQKITASGCLLSMFSPGTQVERWHFPVRNRLMAALADAVVVIEAQADSGSLITARAAQQLGRPVLAFPGSIGTEWLLARGARLVRSVAEVLHALHTLPTLPLLPDGELALSPADRGAVPLASGPAAPYIEVSSAAKPAPPPLLAEPETAGTLDSALVAALVRAAAPVDVDALCATTGRPVADCAAALIGLELRGRCTRLAGGRYIVHAPLS